LPRSSRRAAAGDPSRFQNGGLLLWSAYQPAPVQPRWGLAHGTIGAHGHQHQAPPPGQRPAHRFPQGRGIGGRGRPQTAARGVSILGPRFIAGVVLQVSGARSRGSRRRWMRGTRPHEMGLGGSSFVGDCFLGGLLDSGSSSSSQVRCQAAQGGRSGSKGLSWWSRTRSAMALRPQLIGAGGSFVSGLQR